MSVQTTTVLLLPVLILQPEEHLQVAGVLVLGPAQPEGFPRLQSQRSFVASSCSCPYRHGLGRFIDITAGLYYKFPGSRTSHTIVDGH